MHISDGRLQICAESRCSVLVAAALLILSLQREQQQALKLHSGQLAASAVLHAWVSDSAQPHSPDLQCWS